jgi:hypothetical protein
MFGWLFKRLDVRRSDESNGFNVDVAERKVTHKSSGISFVFYEGFTNGGNVLLKDNPEWIGDRQQLMTAAAHVAVASGMR